MLFFKKKNDNITDSDIRTYSIYDVLGTVLTALHIFIQKYAHFFCGIYPHNFNLINSGLLIKDFSLNPRAAIYFLYSVLQVTSFPRVFIYHLSNSNNSISKIGLGYRFHENKQNAFHKMPGKCEVLNFHAPPPPHWTTLYLKQEPFILVLNPQDLTYDM